MVKFKGTDLGTGGGMAALAQGGDIPFSGLMV